MNLSFIFKPVCLLAALFPLLLSAQTNRLPFTQFPTGKSATAGTINCGFDEVRKPFKTIEAFKLAEQRMNDRVLARYQQRTDTTAVTVPVVIHIVGNNPFSITEAQIAASLQNLNDAFGKAGLYSSSTGVDTYIRFCLAKTDPDGGITNGITRTVSFFGEHLNPLIEDDRLKNLIIWDPNQYINIWLVNNMELEVVPRFECNRWIRQSSQGYATMPPGGGPLDGIVVASLDYMLIEQMGHYLGLYHTYEGTNCLNNNCNTDGDKVCDTPPDASVGDASSCSSPTNSCHTDTLSGFTTDVPDLIANFMDNGNAACHNQFTAGQAQRMINTINTERPGLLVNKCSPPCALAITAGFTQSIAYPVVGNTVAFTNTSTGGTTYQWLVNGLPAATTVNFSATFPAAGKYKITLKAFSGSACFASSTQHVIVNCGVIARFYTDKRQIASKAPSFIDSIRFINNSYNGVSYKWLMQNDSGMAEQVVSTAVNFTYKFLKPANYKVRLIATNGSCTDTTEFFTIPVTDPSPNGLVVFSKAECYQETQVRVNFYVCNAGFQVIPAGLPLSFYDANPTLPTANRVGNIFILPDTIQGKCCSFVYTTILNVGYKKLNQLFIVFNDSGNTRPLSLPNTSFTELDYNNNIASGAGFAFIVSASPKVSVLEPGDTIQLSAQAQGTGNSYQWSTPVNLSCTACQSPLLIADTTTTKMVKASSSLGCTDTTSVQVQVPPYNDFSIRINDLQCSKADSLYLNFTLSNSFKRPTLPKTLSVSFYNGDPATTSAVLLPPVFSLPATIAAGQATLSAVVKAPAPGVNIYAVVNDSGRALPVTFPNTILLEKNYKNNVADTTYATDPVLVQPDDTTIFRKQSVTLNITTPIYNATTTRWTTGSGYTLSCTTCTNTVATVTDSVVIPIQTANKFGCIIYGAPKVNVFPPDMQLRILGTRCITNGTMEVTFNICMNNSYDSVFAGVPVAFYNANPDSGRASLLGPVFYTSKAENGSCHTYSTIIAATTTGQLFGVVNDNGTSISSAPNTLFAETNTTNNIADTSYIPFTVSVVPADTSIDRLGSIQLIPVVQGGIVTSYLWSPAQFLSCTTCANPVATPTYTSQYILSAKNETGCTDTALVIIRTHTTDGVFIPDAFTPNNDGLNDVFYVLGGKEVTLLKSFLIFNRWGQKVFERQNVAPNTPANGWNGRVGANQVETGTYVYSVVVSMADGTEQLRKGTVVLIK